MFIRTMIATLALAVPLTTQAQPSVIRPQSAPVQQTAPVQGGGPGQVLGEYLNQGLSLSRRPLLRPHQTRHLHDGECSQGLLAITPTTARRVLRRSPCPSLSSAAFEALTGEPASGLNRDLWDGLDEICRREGWTRNEAAAAAQAAYPDRPRTSAVRSYLFVYFRLAATEMGHAAVGHGAE